MKSTPKPETNQPGNAVELHIDELVLHGFASGNRRQISSAVQSELTRLLSEGNLPGFRQNPPAVDRVNGGTLWVKVGSKPQEAGAEIARAVFRSLQQHGRAESRGRNTAGIK